MTVKSLLFVTETMHIKNPGCLPRYFIFLCVLAPGHGSAQQIDRVAQFDTWPGVSQLISYNDQIWFVNSQPYQDTNVADIYSFSPASSKLSYERSLFSQDVGNPVIYDGLLHWPFEDPRRSAGTGEYAVTDGNRWQWNYMQSGSVMHVHAMNVCNDQLVAVTGSWTGQLHTQQPDDTWQLSYDYPAGSASFSRLVNVEQLDDTCIVGAAARGKKEAKLFSLTNAQPASVAGWPVSDRVDELTVHKGELFGFTDTGSDRALMHFNGTETQEVSLPATDRPRALHSNGDNLWLVSQYRQNEINRGRLWVYGENGLFNALKDFEQAPVSLTSYKNQVYIGTYHPKGGSLWRYTNYDNNSGSKRTVPKVAELGKIVNPPPDQNKVDSFYRELTEIANDLENTEGYSRGLRRKIGRHPDIKTLEFGIALTRVLKDNFAAGEVTMFNQQTMSRETLIRWYLLTTMAISGHGTVDPEWIKKYADLPDSRSGKLFDPSVAAIVAVGWIGQNDKATINALVQRLNEKETPVWLQADLIGSLSALTEKRFAYDIEAWNQWWRSQ